MKDGKRATRKVEGFSDFEKQAIKERAREVLGREKGEEALLTKISEMKGEDKKIAERLHELVKIHAPGLSPRTWYGMPAYANSEGKVVCFFQAASKFEARYATLGFSDTARLDEGEMWPTSFAITKITESVEEQIEKLLIQAIGGNK